MLCEAVIITPISALKVLIKYGNAGVGKGPKRITSIPIEIKPAVSKGSKKYPDNLVSFEIRTYFLWFLLVARKYPVVFAIFKHVSAVIGS